MEISYIQNYDFYFWSAFDWQIKLLMEKNIYDRWGSIWYTDTTHKQFSTIDHFERR